MTQKDKKDLAFGVKYKVDFVALSFVKNAQDIRELRGILSRLEKRKNPRTKIIAKIERQEAVDHFDEIVREADGVMIARGDLGIELDVSEIPVLQKKYRETLWLGGSLILGGLAAVGVVLFRRRKNAISDIVL